MYFSNWFIFPLHDLFFLDNESISSDDHHNEGGDTSKLEDSAINSGCESVYGMNTVHTCTHIEGKLSCVDFLIANQEHAL